MTQKYDKVQDSGKRQDFETGAVRDTQDDKPRFDLLPVPALQRVAQHYANGAKKYGDRNWEKGMPFSRFYASALRHLFAFVNGSDDEDHLSAVTFNILAMIHFQETGQDKTLDDLRCTCGQATTEPTVHVEPPAQVERRVGSPSRRKVFLPDCGFQRRINYYTLSGRHIPKEVTEVTNQNLMGRDIPPDVIWASTAFGRRKTDVTPYTALPTASPTERRVGPSDRRRVRVSTHRARRRTAQDLTGRGIIPYGNRIRTTYGRRKTDTTSYMDLPRDKPKTKPPVSEERTHDYDG